MPTVSVIIPAYNPGQFLRQAVESIYAQSFTDWELIVVDDDSTEDLSWVSREFPRVRLIRQQHGGASVARNNGIMHSTGEFIAFLDQDDLFRPKRLERAVAALEAVPDAGLCYCDLELIDAEGRLLQPYSRAIEVTPGVLFAIELDGSAPQMEGERRSRLHQSAEYFARRFVVPGSVLVRRHALAVSGLLDPFIPFCGDFDLLIKLGARFKVLHVPGADMLYRRHGNNFTAQYDVGRREVEALISRYVAFARTKGDDLLARKAKSIFRRPSSLYASQAFDCARISLRRKEYKALAYHMSRAIQLSPSFVARSLWGWCLALRRGGRAAG